MADSLLSFGVEKLWDLLVRESERFQGVQEQFDGLKSEVKMLRCFLEDADAKKHTSAMVRNAVKDIKEIVCDAEDIIETFLLKEELCKTSGIKKHIKKLAWVIADRRGLAFDMEALSKRITKVIRDIQILSIQQVIVKERDTQSLQERQRVMRQTFSSDNEDHLVGLEKKVLETQKALIVLDDIWREEDWDIIKPMFPRNKGWKVLLTSRNEGVGLRADPKCFTFKPDSLTSEESWTFFQRIAFPRENSTEHNADKEMEEMGKHMIKHCGGLPLAVKVLGGLLAAQYTLREWKRVYENIRSHIVGGTSFSERNLSSVYQILYLSFEELPFYLKHCFLYLAHFPEDCEIKVEKLSYYWAAEVIPRPKGYNGVTIREVADGYIEELVKRNMVISARHKLTSRFETCQLHDMMREVCLRKAEEENFVDIVGTANSQFPCKSRRIAVHLHGDPKEMLKNPKLRSLLFINDTSKRWMPTDLLFTRLQLLRSLDLSYANFKGGKLPSSIGKLIHLRYLSLFCAEVTQLPSSMLNLKQLLYLNLYVFSSSPIYMLNNVLNEMRELIYLYLPLKIDDKVKMELGNLVNLERLENLSTKHCSVRDLHQMKRLQTLKIIFNGGCTMETLSSSLSELSRLENLRIDGYTYDGEEGFVLDWVHLKHLTLEDIYMPRLPDEQHFPSHLTTLNLRNCYLEEDPMPILEKLIQFKEVALWDKSFCGKRMVCSGGGFPQLQKLQLYRLEEWEEWIVEEDSMPLLHTLDIDNCKTLKELPDGLRFITSLKELKIYIWKSEFKEKLSKGGEDFYKVQHIPLLKIL